MNALTKYKARLLLLKLNMKDLEEEPSPYITWQCQDFSKIQYLLKQNKLKVTWIDLKIRIVFALQSIMYDVIYRSPRKLVNIGS